MMSNEYEQLFASRLERLLICDALVATDSEYRVEYIQTSIKDGCYTVMRGADVLVLTESDGSDDRDQVLRFLQQNDLLTGAVFRVERSGSICGLWDNDIAELVDVHSAWMVTGSPHTGERKTQFRRLMQKNERVVLDPDGQIREVLVRNYRRGQGVVEAPYFVVGNVYSIHAARRDKRLGYVRIESIHIQTLSQIAEREVFAEGWSRRDQFLQNWNQRRQLRADAKVWTVKVALVLEAADTPALVPLVLSDDALPAVRTTLPVQLSFLSSVA